MYGPYLWNHYSQRLQIQCAAWSCGLVVHYCLPSNSLCYLFFFFFFAKILSRSYLWNCYSQGLQIECDAWFCGLVLHYCLPSNLLRYFFFSATILSGPYLWNHYSQRLQTECAAWSCGLILHCCLPSNSLRYWTKVRGIAPQFIIIIVTQPLHESRVYWIHDLAPPTSRRPAMESADTPASAILKESPGAPSTQPERKKSRRRRRRKAARTANHKCSIPPGQPHDPG